MTHERPHKKRALIFGITGQDGAYLAAHLLRKNYEVHGAVRPSSMGSRLYRLEHLRCDIASNDLKMHQCDIMDAARVSQIIQETSPDELYNLAAQSHVHESFTLPSYTAQIDAIGATTILEALRRYDLLQKTRYYQASTSELFGNAPAPQNEATPMIPQSPYGAAKLYAFQMTRIWREAYNAFACNGILFNHESPLRGDNFVTKKIVDAFVGQERVKSEGSNAIPTPLYIGNLEARRDWGHAADYVDGMWRMLQQPVADDFVLATGVSHSVKACIDLCAALMDIDLHWSGQAFAAPVELDGSTAITAATGSINEGLTETTAGPVTESNDIDATAAAVTVGVTGNDSLNIATGDAAAITVNILGNNTTSPNAVTFTGDVVGDTNAASLDIAVGSSNDADATLILQGNVAASASSANTITLGDGANTNTTTLVIDSDGEDENLTIAADIEGTAGDTSTLTIQDSLNADNTGDVITITGAVGGAADAIINQMNIGGAALTDVAFTGAVMNVDAVDVTASSNITLNNGGGNFDLGSVTDSSTGGSTNLIITDGDVDVTGAVNLGDGADTITLTAGTFDAASVDLGAGANVVNLVGGTIGTTANDFTVTGGADADDINITATTVNATLALGAGANTLDVTGAAALDGNITAGDDGNAIDLGSAATLAGAITTGTGVDTITIGGGTHTGAITTGAGADVFNFTGTTSGNIDLGADADDFNAIGTAVVNATLTGVEDIDIADNGDLTLNIGGANTYAGTITEQNAGEDQTLTLTSGIYTGAITLGGGTNTVTVGTATVNGALSGVADINIADSGTLTLGTDYAAAISGSTPANDQNLVLNAGTFTGSADLDGGANVITISGTAVAGGGTFAATGATSTLNVNTSTSFSGDITGYTLDVNTADTVATLVAAGGGGDNTFNVQDINTAASTSLIVNEDTTAAGDITNNGNITIASDVTLGADNYLVASDGTLTYNLTNSGSAVDGGTLAIGTAADLSATDVVIAGNIGLGTVANVITGANVLTAGVGSLADTFLFNYELVANAANTDLVITENNSVAGSLSSAGNNAAGTTITSLLGSNVTNTELNTFLTNVRNAGSAATVASTVEAVLPTLDGGSFAATADISAQNSAVIGDRLASLRGHGAGVAAGNGVEPKKVWGQIIGSTAEQDMRDGVAGYDMDSYGFALGTDFTVDSQTTLGVALSYSDTEVDSEDAASTSTEIDTYQLTLYGEYEIDNATYVNAQLGYAYSENDVTRTVPSRRSYDFEASTYTAAVEAGRTYATSEASEITPRFGLSYMHYDADGYTDQVAGGVKVDMDALNSLEAIIGADWTYTFETAQGQELKPYVSAEFAYDVIGDEVEATTRFLGGGSAFKTEGADSQDERFNIGTGLTFVANDQWEVSAGYEFEYKEDYEGHTGRVKASYNF